MHARTIDTGATIAELRAFGPPDVVKFDVFSVASEEVLGADKLWTVVRTVSLNLAGGVDSVDARPLLSWRTSDGTLIAQVIPPFGATGAHTMHMTFAINLPPGGAANGPVIAAPIPEIVLLPGWTMHVELPSTFHQEQVRDLCVLRQRYQLITLDELIED
jgi:hypothetical protein